MQRFEVIVRQRNNGVLSTREIEAIARNSIEALLSVVSAIKPQGSFTTVVRPYEKGI